MFVDKVWGCYTEEKSALAYKVTIGLVQARLER